MSSFKLANRIEVRSKYSNIDALYGPYESVEAACEAIPESRRAIGLTVGISNINGFEEYQWKLGVENEQLVPKIEKINLTISISGESTLNFQEGDNVTVGLKIEGRAGIQKGLLYRVQGNSEIFVGELSNLGKGNNSIEIKNILTSGTYIYRVKVLDSTGSFATTLLNNLYVEYTIKYGGISVSYDLIELDSIKVKNIYTVGDKKFHCTINVRDNSFNITNVELGYYNDDNFISVKLYNRDNYLGRNQYIFPTSNELNNSGINGKTCYIVISYTENDESHYIEKELFTLLDVFSLEIIPENYNLKTYYLNIPSTYTFTLQTGIENISISLNPNENSDFTFKENTTITSYIKYSLKVTPKNITDSGKLIIDYMFYYNNDQFTGTKELILGNIEDTPELNYIEGDNSTFYREDIVFANADNYDVKDEDNGIYYKILNDTSIDINNVRSFLLDIYCKIDKTGYKDTTYLTIKDRDKNLAVINEDLITLKETIITDTPLNEWVQIGLGYGVYLNLIRNGSEDKIKYFAIYINGQVVKNIPVSTLFDINIKESLNILFSNNIQVQKCFLYYTNLTLSPYLDANANGESIIYNNYLQHLNNSSSEPDSLPLLKLKRITGTDAENYLEKINSKKSDKIRFLTKFGEIGSEKAKDMAEYDSEYDNTDNIFHDNVTLFRQNVNIKKPAQKEYAVLCTGEYIVNGTDILSGLIIEVHTQGTSTLEYTIPNFKFTFWKIDDNDEIKKFYPELIPRENGYYYESTYTAKIDYMDSSHLNNTPTCIYYNNLIQNLVNSKSIKGTPSARNNGLDAIVGIPIIMEVADDNQYINIGSFMLNVDKTGDSLGFEVEENGETLLCLSFEGTSNDNEHGAAGRFVLSDSRISYFNDENDIDLAHNNVLDAIHNEQILEPNNDPIGELEGYPYAQWCQFLSDGLEYRYPDSDIIKYKNGKLSKVMDLDHFKKIYKMWSWVSKSDELEQNDYKTQFIQHFNLEYCMLYFILLMIYGQTDNLGKNAMFDTWGEKIDNSDEIWYPRPYDLDSETGLANNGGDHIATFSEILSQYSLDYKSTYNLYELASLHLVDHRINLNELNTILETNYSFEDIQNFKNNPDSVDNEVLKNLIIDDLLKNDAEALLSISEINGLDRYSYSSSTSKLWINFYKNYKSEIENFYRTLRTLFNYSPESIIDLCEQHVINKLGVNQYNIDFNNKYLGTKDQTLAYGNRWYKFKKWITQRFSFCDSYFNCTDYATYDIKGAITYSVKVDSPLYVTSGYQGNNVTKFVLDLEEFSQGSGAETKFTLYASQKSILETSVFKYVTGLNSGNNNYSGLVTLNINGNSNISDIYNFTGTYLPLLKTIDISGSSISSMICPSSTTKFYAQQMKTSFSLSFETGSLLEELNLSGTNIGILELVNLENLKTINLSNCKISTLELSGLLNLTSLNLTGAEITGTINIGNNVKLDTLDFSNLKLANITFNGIGINIKNLIFYLTNFGVNTINLDAITETVEDLDFYGCKNLLNLQINNDTAKFTELKYFTLYNSSIISLGSQNETFNAQYFNLDTDTDNLGMGRLSRVYYSNRIRVKNVNNKFYFYNTKIKNIINLKFKGNGANLFRECLNLESITLSNLTLTNSIDKMFFRCTQLNNIPHSDIIIDESVTSAKDTFAVCQKIPYNSISNIIRKCTNVADFSNMCRNTQLGSGTNEITIDLNDLFGSNEAKTVNLTYMFGTHHNANDYNVSGTTFKHRLEITGSFPNNISNTRGMFIGVNTIKVNYNIFNGSTSLKTTERMFASFVKDDNSMDSNCDLTLFSNDNSNIKKLSKGFFPSNIENMNSMFFDRNLSIDGDVFDGLTQLINCSAVFGASKINLDDPLELNIDNLWNYDGCKILDISGCFLNRPKVGCSESLNFNTNNLKIKVSALFGITNFNGYLRSDTSTIQICLEDITNNLTIGDGQSSYQSPHGGYNSVGLFLNRNIQLKSSSDSNKNVLSKLSGNCYNAFNKSEIDVGNITKFDLSNVGNCTGLFEGCKTSKTIEVQMPNNCSNYTNMFKDSIMLSRLPEIKSSESANFNYTFSSCKVGSGFSLPHDYFKNCKNNITNLSYMFYGNKFLDTLEYNSDGGLLEDCVKLENVDYMFGHALYLRGGIPNNLFGSENKELNLSKLNYMFETTAILYFSNSEITTESVNKCISQSLFKPLRNSLESIEGLFNATQISNNDYVSKINDTSVFSNDCFTECQKLKNISRLFLFAYIIEIPKFYKFESALDAFGNIRNQSNFTELPDNFVNQSLYIKDVTRMFYSTSSLSNTVTKLSDFVNNLSSFVTKSFIVGNRVNEPVNDPLLKGQDISDNLKHYPSVGYLWNPIGDRQ